MQDRGGQLAAFAEPTPLDALTAVYDRRVARMVDRGLARCLYTDKAEWRHTALGGVVVCLHFFVQLAGAFPQFWRVNRGPIASPLLKTAPVPDPTARR